MSGHPGRIMGERILVGRIGAAHGVRGEVKVKPFTEDPATLARLGPLETGDGRKLAIAGIRPQGDGFVARITGVADRNAAEALRNLDLFVDRAALPAIEAEDEFYYADLVGLAAVTVDGTALGRVVAIQDFGAGDLVEIEPPGGGTTRFLPFTRAIVPVVDIAGGRIVVAPPEESEARPEDEDEGEDPGATDEGPAP
ncbi:16S rRNA processing protein RimM [Prosthecomicrobium pneumaticum]|uniref:Ribosome maturation factor RimM n=2 Tax=Prosthecomicrobium pneumaticum TaxID=81895 RepID=A0A7W9FMH9_9HYPH|nr:16S rRNA processing protein RimM [Prosthecomicrobium pneumaticum]